MIPRPPRSTRTDTLFPYTTLFRSFLALVGVGDGVVHLDVPAMGVEEADVDPRAGALQDRLGLLGVPDIGQGRPPRLAVDQQPGLDEPHVRSEAHTSELQSLMRISYAVFCLKQKIISSTDCTT